MKQLFSNHNQNRLIDESGINGILSGSTLSALKKGLTIVIKLQLGDDDVGGVDLLGDSGSVGLGGSDTLNKKSKLLAVDAENLTRAILLITTDDGDLIILTDRNRANVVLLAELLGERSRKDLSADGRRSREVSLAGLSRRRADN